MLKSIIYLRLLCFISLLFLSMPFNAIASEANTTTDENSNPRAQSLGSSFFLLGNLAPGDSPYFFLLNYGHQFTTQDWLYVEAITWTYYEPLGTYGSSDKTYPGKVRAVGAGIGYQRFHWRNLYTTIQATPFYQQFIDTNDKEIQSGYQLYLQVRVGYRFLFGNNRWFIDPSIAFNYWPVNTNVPVSFGKIDEGSSNYFLFEPGLHFGVLF